MTLFTVAWLVGLLAEAPSTTTGTTRETIAIAFIAMLGTVMVAAIPAFFSYKASLSSRAAAKEARNTHDEITTSNATSTAGQQIEALTKTLIEVQRQQVITQRQVNAVLGILADMQIEDAVSGQPHLKPSDIIRIIHNQENS